MSPPSGSPSPPVEEALAAVRERLASLHYGSIALTVHEGRIVQLDIVEKRRLAR